MPLTLTTDCPSQETGGEYAFYNYQRVILTATLDHAEGDIVDGTLVYFSHVGEYEQLQPVGNDWVPVDGEFAVGVPLLRAPDAGEKWYAKLVVRVTGRDLGNGMTYAYLDNSRRSADLPYTINPVSCLPELRRRIRAGLSRRESIVRLLARLCRAGSVAR